MRGRVFAAAVLLCVLAVVGMMFYQDKKSKADAESLVEQFAITHNANLQDALALLSDPAIFDEQAVDEAEAESRWADYFIRQSGRIVKVQTGEPGSYEWIKSPNRFTLITKIAGTAPPLNVRNSKGEIEKSVRMSMMNPAIIVEVRDGKIHPMRTESHH
jgi:hypothetical protein